MASGTSALIRVLGWVSGGTALLAAPPAIYGVFANLVSPAAYSWSGIGILVAVVLVSGAVSALAFIAPLTRGMTANGTPRRDSAWEPSGSRERRHAPARAND